MSKAEAVQGPGRNDGSLFFARYSRRKIEHARKDESPYETRL
jgi:hypothetical protein